MNERSPGVLAIVFSCGRDTDSLCSNLLIIINNNKNAITATSKGGPSSARRDSGMETGLAIVFDFIGLGPAKHNQDPPDDSVFTPHRDPTITTASSLLAGRTRPPCLHNDHA